MSFLRKATLATAAALVLVGPAEAHSLKAEFAGQTGLTTIVLQVLGLDLVGTGAELSINSDQTLSRSVLKLAAGQINVAIKPPPAFAAMSKGGVALHPIVHADSGIESPRARMGYWLLMT